MSRPSVLPLVPALRLKSAGEEVTSFLLRLTRARERSVVRLTGGCGHMSADDATGLYQMFQSAFDGFGGALLFGGTRMVLRHDVRTTVPGITEVAPIIREHNLGVVSLGVVPRTDELKLADFGLVVSDHPKDDYLTIIHPNQDQCLVVQVSADQEETWDAEWQECLRLTDHLRQSAHWTSLLVSYNGGSVTERELVATAEKGWPVLLIDGSGRTTERYAQDADFLQRHPNVVVAERSAASIRQKLMALGILPNPQPLSRVTQGVHVASTKEDR